MFNSSLNVYKTEWLDLVFEKRNKNYGAYVLRAESSSIMVKSLLLSGSLFLLLFFSPLIYNKIFPAQITTDPVTKTVEFTDVIHSMKKKVEEKKVDVLKVQPAPAKIKTVNNSANIVVVDEPKTKPPTVDETKDAVVASITQDGEINPNASVGNIVGKGGTGTDKGEDVGAPSGDSNVILDPFGIDEFPSFIGGEKAFAKYIQRNLRYPEFAQENGIMGKVFISFVIEKDGSVTNVSLLKGIGSGCDEEAIKVIKKSPFWKPGKNKGIPVRVRYNIPINFTIGN